MPIPLYHFKKKVRYSNGFTDTIHTYACFCCLGLEFSYHGDTVVWLYPWCRKAENGRGKPFLSLGTFGVFNHLKEIDEFWEEFWKDHQKMEIDNYLES